MTKEKLNNTENHVKKKSFKKKIKEWRDFLTKCLKQKKGPTNEKEADSLSKNKVSMSNGSKSIRFADLMEELSSEGGGGANENLVRSGDLREELSSEGGEGTNENPIRFTDFKEELNPKGGKGTNEND